MKKVKDSKFENFPASSLYREDLEEIITLLKSGCKDVTISDGEYEFASLDELAQKHPTSLSRLEIKGHPPYVSLSFRREPFNGTRLYASEEDAAEPVFLKVRELMRRKKRTICALFPPVFWMPAFIIAQIGVRLLDTQEIHKAIVSLIVSIGMLLSLLFNGGFMFFISTKSVSQRGQFWETNKDKIFLAVISAIIGAIISWLVAKIK
jgi:hypothetical protein